jgi:hypothetical protein
VTKTEWSEAEMNATLETLRTDRAAFDDALKTVLATAAAIKPFLAGLEPVVQSLTLAELLVVYLMGFQNPEQRLAVLARHDELVRLLIQENEAHVARLAAQIEQEAAHG